MQKIALIVIALVLFSGFAMSATKTTTATVTITEFIDISITPCAGGTATSIGYGSQDPGATNVDPVDCHDATNGDLEVRVEATTNVPVTIKISGTDYGGPGAETIAVGNTEYDEVVDMTSAVAFTISPVDVWTSMGGEGSAVSDDLWFELDIPSSFLTAGAYTSTYTFDASKT